jgi:hypothetical protein
MMRTPFAIAKTTKTAKRRRIRVPGFMGVGRVRG